jgi:MFS family permease
MASTTRAPGSIRGALALHYGLTGILNALWAATLPATDARLDLGAGWVGALLAALAVSALVAMPVTGWLAGRWPGRRMLRFAVLGASLAVAGPALAKSHATLAIAVVVLGAASGPST